MKQHEFDLVRMQIPRVMARFELLRDQHDGEYKKGDKFLYHPNDCMIPEKHQGEKPSLFAHSSKFKFIGYFIVRKEFGEYVVVKEYKENEENP